MLQTSIIRSSSGGNQAMKTKRILWLLNHTTLRDFEVPLLMDMGYEVYVPKRTPEKVPTFRSGTVTHTYDETLTLPAKIVQEMNAFNFYESKWPAQFAATINRHFDMAIITGRIDMVNHVCAGFSGDVIIRKFGRIGELATFSDQVTNWFDKSVLERILKKQRIWFGYAYENLPEGEKKWLRDIGVFLPVGLPKSFFERQNTWQPVRDQILFICPEIAANPYYSEVYDDFISAFGEFPYIIPGEQSQKVIRDPNVTGFLPRADFDHLMQTCKVMYYHSRETYHLHYHPIEAMMTGMPVIHMAGGMLHRMAGEKLPGCCDTIAEAQEKVARILAGDGEFIQQVVTSQKMLVRQFSPEYTGEVWKKNFPPRCEPRVVPAALPLPTDAAEKKLSVGFWMHEIHPEGFTGEGITRLMAQLVREIQRNDGIDLHIACVSWVKKSIIQFMTDLGVDGRRLKFITVDDDPPLVFSVYQWWTNRKRRDVRGRSGLRAGIRNILGVVKEKLLEKVVVLRGIAGWLLLGISGIIATPVIILFMLYKLIQLVFKPLGAITRWIIAKTSTRLPGLSGRFRQLEHEVFAQMVTTEVNRLVEKVRARKDIDGWYIAYPSMPQIKNLDRPTVVAVPDIVYLDFPLPYALEVPEIFAVHPSIESTIRSASSIITFSDNVKNKHIVGRGYHRYGDVHVIHHAPINVRDLITHHPSASDEEIRYRAKHIIAEYLDENPLDKTNQTRKYLQNLQFGSMDYFLVSSQTRPHKNHLNLIKAYEILLRKKFVNAKLVLTGRINPEMQEFLERQKLHLDVISLNYLPAKVHAAFYACANLTIAPHPVRRWIFHLCSANRIPFTPRWC